ncbi:6921_t:CDS:1, partial [Diversispora eburnea]
MRNPTALFNVFIQSDAFYLLQILSLIELHNTIHLLWEIDTIDGDEIK